MAIAYARLEFARLQTNGGACKELAYAGRCEIFDPRLGVTFDFRNRADLVCETIIAPADVVRATITTSELAQAIDAAEFARVRRPLAERRRLPQVGAEILVALPPDDQLTLDEAFEVSYRMMEHFRGDRLLMTHTAMHDPALLTPGAQTRHCHAFVPQREWQNGQFTGSRLREMFARPRHSAAPNVRKSFVAEGIDWPRLSWEIQQLLFSECAIDLVVDPIAPYSESHWAPNAYRTDPRVAPRKLLAHQMNLEAIHGDPVQLIEDLQNGRSTLQISELKRIIAKFIDADGDRRDRLDTILMDPKVVTLAATCTEAKPRFVTTKTTCDLMIDAASLVDHAAHDNIRPAIHAVTAPDHDGVVTAIHRLLRGNCLSRFTRASRPLFLGLRHSEVEPLARAAEFARPVIATIDDVLNIAIVKGPANSRRRVALRRGGLVVLPHAEAIGDQMLARLLLACQAKGATALLGHDQSRKTGIVCHRLAAHAVEQLTVPPVLAQDERYDRETVELWLRSGLIGRAIKSIMDSFAFAPVDDADDDALLADFTVCDDPRRVAALNDRQQTLIHPDSVALDLPNGKIVLRRDQWITFTKTDYSARPPRIRAGLLAKVVEIDLERNTIRFLLPDGETETIALNRCPHIRLAYAISIREARRIKEACRLRIEITDRRYAWAALVLAAVQHQSPSIIVDPQVAGDVTALIATVRTSLPGAIPHDLTHRPDPDAEVSKILRGNLRDFADAIVGDAGIEMMPELALSSASSLEADGITTAALRPSDMTEIENVPEPDPRTPPDDLGIEYIPEPPPPKPKRMPAPFDLHERVRKLIASHPDTRAGFALLCAHLDPSNPDHEATARHILELCDPQGLTASIVKLLSQSRHQATAKDGERDEDFPAELESLAPQDWDSLALQRFKTDLMTMRYSAQWNIAQPPKSRVDPDLDSTNRQP